MNSIIENSVAPAQAQNGAFDLTPANVTVNPVGKEKSVKRSRISAFQKTMTSTRRLFSRQLEKSSAMKRKCIDYCVNRYYSDPLRFWEEFKTKRDEILDRASFNRRCRAEGLNPTYVAEHLLIEGSAKVNAVLKGGFAALNGAQVMFNASLYEDTEGLHKNRPSGITGLTGIESGTDPQSDATTIAPAEQNAAVGQRDK